MELAEPERQSCGSDQGVEVDHLNADGKPYNEPGSRIHGCCDVIWVFSISMTPSLISRWSPESQRDGGESGLPARALATRRHRAGTDRPRSLPSGELARP